MIDPAHTDRPMRLTLKIRSYCDSPPMDSRIRSFDTFPIIIGRSNACEFILSDESRYISSNHAVFSLENGQLIIQDTSANGVYINGASIAIGRGGSVALHDNDTVAIGDYTLIVTIEVLASPTPPNEDSYPQNGAERSIQQKTPVDYDPFYGDEPDWRSSSVLLDGGVDDDDEYPMPDSPIPSPSVSAESNGDWLDWVSDQPETPVEPPPRADQVQRNPIPPPTKDISWFTSPASESISIPPSIPESSPNYTARDPQRPQDNRPNEGYSPRPPSHHETSSAPHASTTYRVPDPTTPSRQGQPDGTGPSLNILLKAAALREADFSQCNDAEVLAQTGRLLAHMVDAMMVLLQSRAEIKNAIRSDITMLTRSGNNPLKFSISAADALTKLLVNDTDGYLQADKAIQEAVDDLKLHQLAMLDGMKAAVRSMLLEFDPGKLSKKLEKKGGISANIPITREAKLWELFCEQYDAIHDEAVNDFSEMFGSEFRKAYEKRIRQLGRNPDF